MENRFNALSVQDGQREGVDDNDNGSDAAASDAGNDDNSDASADDEAEHNGHALSPLAAPPVRAASPFHERFHAASLLLQRAYPALLPALALYEGIESECGAADSLSLMKCAACIGEYSMLVSLATARKELYEETQMHYSTAIAQMTRAMAIYYQWLVAHAAAASAVAEPGAGQPREDESAMDKVADCISMVLAHVRQLQDGLLKAQERKQAELEAGLAERDAVRSNIGESRWRTLRGHSPYAERRRWLQDRLGEIEALLDDIHRSEADRERLRHFEAEQRQRQQLRRAEGRSSTAERGGHRADDRGRGQQRGGARGAAGRGRG